MVDLKKRVLFQCEHDFDTLGYCKKCKKEIFQCIREKNQCKSLYDAQIPIKKLNEKLDILEITLSNNQRELLKEIFYLILDEFDKDVITLIRKL